MRRKSKPSKRYAVAPKKPKEEIAPKPPAPAAAAAPQQPEPPKKKPSAGGGTPAPKLPKPSAVQPAGQSKPDAQKAATPGRTPELVEDIFYANPRHQSTASMLREWSALVRRRTLALFEEMRADDQVRIALALKKQFVLGTGWTIESPKGMPEDWEVTQFVRDALEQMRGSFSRTILNILSALDFGFSVTEKVFEEREWAPKAQAAKPKPDGDDDLEDEEPDDKKEPGAKTGSVLPTNRKPKKATPPAARFAAVADDGEADDSMPPTTPDDKKAPPGMGDNGGPPLEEPVSTGGPKLMLKTLRTIAPFDVKFVTNEFGEMLGVVQMGNRDSRANSSGVPINSKEPDPIAANKLVVYSYNAEFGNLYGRSDLESAFRAWMVKDQSYLYLAKALERFGTPPVLAHYDAQAVGPATQQALRTAMENWQNGMTGLFPRGEKKDSLEFWTPDLMNQTGEAFDRALRMFDGAIARGILMPSLIGATNDTETGSYARSDNHLDVFMLIIEFLRTEAVDVIQEQIVKPLVDLNFVADDYPRFKFLPLEGKPKTELLRAWGDLTGQKVVQTTPADEKHIRATMGFPDYEVAVESAAELGDDNPYGPSESGGGLIDPKTGMPVPPGQVDPESGAPVDADGEELDPADPATNPALGAKPANAPPFPPKPKPKAFSEAGGARRELTACERKVDFAAIERDLDGMTASYAERLRQAMARTLADLQSFIRTSWDGSTGFVTSFEVLPGRDAWAEAIGSLFKDGFDQGRESVRGEVPKAFAEELPTADYTKALQYLRTKAFWVTGVEHDKILAQVRKALIQAISTGEGVDKIMERLRGIFEPYVAANASAPGVLLEPARLETIVRTNLNDVYNMGRMQQARQAGDFLDGFQYSAVLDNRTTDVCQHLDGLIFRADDPRADQLRPPRHYNCRSIFVPIVVGEEIDDAKVISDEQAQRAEELSGKDF